MTGPLIEAMALAMLNRDRNASGWPSVKSRDSIENSHGYVECAKAALSVVKQHLTSVESVERATLARINADMLKLDIPEISAIGDIRYQDEVDSELQATRITLTAALEGNKHDQ
jgi:hypothetical protein